MSRRACATGAPRPREGPPGHRCHCAELTSPHFRDCGRPTVCRRSGRIRMRPLDCAGRLPVLFRAARQRARTRVSREDSAIVIGVSCSNFNSTRWPGRRPPAELPSHPAPSPPCLRASVEGAQNLTKTGTGHAPLGSRARDCNNSEHTRSRPLAAKGCGWQVVQVGLLVPLS